MGGGVGGGGEAATKASQIRSIFISEFSTIHSKTWICNAKYNLLSRITEFIS